MAGNVINLIFEIIPVKPAGSTGIAAMHEKP
jgi:hypothetical protein